MRTNTCRRGGRTGVRRRQAAAKARSILSGDDRATLRRLAALASRHPDLLLDHGGRIEVLRSGFDLAEALSCWLHRADPGAFGRWMRSRP